MPALLPVVSMERSRCVVKSKRTKAGLLLMLERASLRLDPTQKALAVKSMKEFVHAISVKDQKAAEQAVESLARVFLRMPLQVGSDE